MVYLSNELQKISIQVSVLVLTFGIISCAPIQQDPQMHVMLKLDKALRGGPKFTQADTAVFDEGMLTFFKRQWPTLSLDEATRCLGAIELFLDNVPPSKHTRKELGVNVLTMFYIDHVVNGLSLQQICDSYWHSVTLGLQKLDNQ